MAESCKQQEERVEETVFETVDKWVEQQEERCRDEPCNPWLLCLNKVVCWVVTALMKVAITISKVIVRLVYTTVCTVVSLIIGVLALFIGNTDILMQALKDLWQLAKDVFYSTTGAVIFYVLRVVDIFQSAFGLQPAKRKLTDDERTRILRPIFGGSLNYDAIELVVGSAGILTTKGRALTMGTTIYLPVYSEYTLVHECVHVWQFLYEGFKYIGNSAFNQLDQIVFHPGYQPYNWRPRIDAGESWATLKSAEAQAQFIEDVYVSGWFDVSDPTSLDDTAYGAFFRHGDNTTTHLTPGHNVFVDPVSSHDYTNQANAAWRIIRTP